MSLLRGPVSAAFLALPLALLAGTPGTQGAALPTYTDATSSAGISFLHAGDPTRENLYVEIMGSGACWFDYDADDWPDLFLVNAKYSNASLQASLDPRSKLYRNLGNGTFEDTTGSAGLGLQAWAQGCAAGDYDNDRDADLYVTAYGEQFLYKNNGNGTFTDVAQQAGVLNATCGSKPCFSSSAAWLDYDLDGDLDLYLLNYVAWDIAVGGFASPIQHDAQCNVMFRNNGDGTFSDATNSTGTGDCDGKSLAVATGDYNGDGWQDIFVASDETVDDLYRNNGDGTFTDVAEALGVADGRGGMGADFEDFDGDDRPDLVITHYEGETFALYRSTSQGAFEDIASSHGLDSTKEMVGWGAAFADVDNDGLLDVVLANGHVSANFSTTANYDQRNRVFRGLPNGSFEDVSDRLGAVFEGKKAWRGLALADYDMDGFLDMALVPNPNQSAALWHSERGPGNFLTLRLRGNGTGVNTDAYGAVVWVEAGGELQRREVGQASYLSQHSLDLHFGLGNLTKADKVSVRWPSHPPVWQNFTGVDANQVLKLEQGGSLQPLRSLPVAATNSSSVVALRGEDVRVSGWAARAPSPVASYRWDWGDGNASDGANASHEYGAVGTYTARFRVTDERGLWDEEHVGVKVVEQLANRPPVADAGPDQQGNRRAAVHFNGSASSDPDGRIVNHTWDFGDGAKGYGAEVDHLYAALGAHTVTLTVRDDEGAEASDMLLATIVNLLPLADGGLDRSGPTDAPFRFDGSASRDPDGVVMAWHWDFGDGGSAEGMVVEHRYAAAGTYNATLTVRDNDNATARDTIRVRPGAVNALPAAEAGPDRQGKAGRALAFDGSASRDPDGSVIAWRWDFGDGSTGQGEVTEHAYGAPGTYTIRLTVTDNEGAEATDTAQATIAAANRPPVADAGPDLAVDRLTDAVLDGRGSRDPDGLILNYTWDLADGTLAYGPVVKHRFARLGSHEVALTVTDDDNAPARDTLVVEVRNLPPVSDPGPARDLEGVGPVAFDGSASRDPDGAVASYAWDFGDGATAQGATVSHAYRGHGRYAVRLTVTDSDGASASASASLWLYARPEARIGPAGDRVANRVEPQRFDGSASTDADGRVVAWRWDFGDGGTAEGAVVEHTYPRLGVFPVTLTVTDDDGFTAEASASVEVVNLPPVPVAPASRALEGLASVGFDGSASFDPDGRVASWAWDFGDSATGTGAAASHAYAGYGRYAATLTVTDNEGLSASAPSPLWLYARPVARIGPLGDRVGNRLEPQPFEGSASTDADGQVVSWEWDFGDGAGGTGARGEHLYGRLGAFTATLTVVDDDGWTGSAQALVTVVNLPPVARAASYALANVHQLIPLDASASSDPDGQVVEHSWDLGESSAQGAVVLHAWSRTGPARAEVVVTDNDGASASAALDIEVVDWLRVRVAMEKDEWSLAERPRGEVEVRFANGLPAPGVEVNLTVAYVVRDPLESGAVEEQRPWRAHVLGTTGPDGRLAFEAPSTQVMVLGREAGPALSAPTLGHEVPFGKHHGSYEVTVQAAWRGNHGEAATSYHVRALPEHDLG